MATDIAEVIGGAVALNLLFHLPLLWGGVITGTVSLALLLLQSRRGPRTFEFVIIGLLVIISVGFTFGVIIAPPEAGSVIGGLVPRFDGAGSVLLAASILGATIMPHAIYAHSALARDRFAPSRMAAAFAPTAAATATSADATTAPPPRSSTRTIRMPHPGPTSRSCAGSARSACCARPGGMSRSR